MFHKVRIFNPKGEVKEIISSRQLSRLHWQNFKKSEEEITLTSSGKLAVPRWVRERLDLQNPEYSDPTCYY